MKSNHELLQASLDALTVEAESLFSILDSLSETIRQLEKGLGELKANFQFRFVTSAFGESCPRRLEERHKTHLEENLIEADRFTIKKQWFLAWEPCDKTKQFRLLLICEEQEVLHYGSEEFYQRQELTPKITYKTPLIETQLQTRLEYSEYLIPFIDEFKYYLRNKRHNIQLELEEFANREKENVEFAKKLEEIEKKYIAGKEKGFQVAIDENPKN